MNKTLTYYFEDLSRLDDVSVHELEEWIAETPYSQPLHKLLHLKCLREGKYDATAQHHNAAYHIVDHDDANHKSDKEAVVENIERMGVANGKAATIVAPPKVASQREEELEPKAKKETSKKGKTNKKSKTKAEIKHSLATDDQEGFVDEEVAEKVVEKVNMEEPFLSESKKKASKRGKKNKKTKSVAEVQYSLATDEMEELVDLEVQEDLSLTDIREAEIVLDSSNALSDASKFEIESASGKDENIEELTLPVTFEELETETLLKEDTTDVEPDALVKDVKPKETLINYKKKDLAVDVVVEEVEADIDVAEFEVEPPKKKSKPKSKKKKKSKSPKSKKRKSKKDKEEPKQKKDKKKSKPSKAKKKDTTKAKKKKLKPKADKKSTKDIAKEIRYIYLEERQPKDYRMHGYDGESDYIKWLIQQKSINQEEIVAETKKKKKSKKKNKVKKSVKGLVLKSAEESVKKRDVIISETLADILAAQGHQKKAKKMYKQLSLIFPEKSSFFAAKIKNLKKK